MKMRWQEIVKTPHLAPATEAGGLKNQDVVTIGDEITAIIFGTIVRNYRTEIPAINP
jgi:hypothetical protein